MPALNGANRAWIEALYAQYLESPSSVEPSWRAFFDERAGIAEFDGGLTRTVAEDTALEACLEAGLDIETARSILGVDPDGLQPPRARTYH